MLEAGAEQSSHDFLGIDRPIETVALNTIQRVYATLVSHSVRDGLLGAWSSKRRGQINGHILSLSSVIIESHFDEYHYLVITVT